MRSRSARILESIKINKIDILTYIIATALYFFLEMHSWDARLVPLLTICVVIGPFYLFYIVIRDSIKENSGEGRSHNE